MSKSSDTDVELPVVNVRWEADASIQRFHISRSTKSIQSSVPVHSSVFRFQKHDCRLQFYYEYNVYVKCKNKYAYILCVEVPGACSLFGASVHVEDWETGRIVPQLSQERRFSDYTSSGHYRIWWMNEDDVQQRVAQIKRNYNKLRFLVVLKKDDGLTDIDTKETQTECCLPEAIGQVSYSTTSTSVQTSVLHSVTPCLESLSEDLAQLMVQDSDPDMEFLCGGQSTRAHKLIVCSRSPVIAAMMASDMVEGRTGVVTIPNMEPDVFKIFLGYLYSGKLEELTFEAALTLYGIGGQYAVHSLAKRCLQFLMEHLSVENACEVLTAVDTHGDSEIVENIIEYILENKIPVVNDYWSAFCDEHPKLAIKVLSQSYKMSLKIGEN